jgi:hypothetical protein
VQAEEPDVERIGRAAVSDFVRRWAIAQNSGSFAGYESLYARPFEGIKRSGPRVQRFDRARWMRDREAMFEQPMRVEISDLQVKASATTAHVVFEQRWSSGRYEDVGQKALTVALEDGQLLITREEMLESKIVATGKRAPASFGKLAHIVDAHGPHAILSAYPVQDVWENGAATLVRRGPPTVVLTKADEERLPAEARALLGSRLRLMRADGVACEGIVDGFDIIGRVVAPWGALPMWNGTAGEPAWSDQAIAKDAWAIAGKDMTARIKPINGNCHGALWAHAESQNAPPAVVSTPPTSAERRAALALFRGLPAYHRQQQGYAASDNTSPSRWEDAGEAPPAVGRWNVGRRDFITVQVNVMTGGCADFSGSLLAIFEVKQSGPRPRLELKNDPDATHGAELLSATMVGGEPTFFYRVDISERGVFRGARALSPSDVLTVPYMACDC